MSRLSLSLLGPFEVALDEQSVTDFESDKVRALLAYLAVERDRPHRRDSLAGLLWADWSDRAARTNLRNALANLRTAIGDRHAQPPFLLITRETIHFNTASDHWLDVIAFRSRVEADQPAARELEEAVDLYRGGFLEGFFVKDSPTFEDWSLLTRERLQRQALSALRWLAEHHERRGDYEQASDYAWRQVELEPWQEQAHQQLMRLLALSGRRGAALAQYETCRRLLAEELGVEPAEDTTRLYDKIRDGELEVTAPLGISAAELPSFLHEKKEGEVERPIFVARKREVAQLDAFLGKALAGRGRVAFVTGEAGSGKTALVQAFVRSAQEEHGDLVVATGNCNAYTGFGDPYLPFREILQQLTGDVEARWRAGAMSQECARRLWQTLPTATRALLDAGPDLIGAFVPGRGLVERAAAATSGGERWLGRLDDLVRRKAAGAIPAGPQQSALFEQYAGALEALARHRPLMLAVDDLQWADSGSVSLLFHLSRHLAGSRILLVGAYRPEEVALGRRGQRHPLEPVVNELRRDLGDVTVDLGQADGRGFVDAFLDSEPNRLGSEFREMLFRQTRGHPLFTIELLRGLQERGDLVKDREGRWIEGPTLDWETLPARVEAVIAERVGRLAGPERRMLRAASVEGETFTSEVVARVHGVDEREAATRLSEELTRRHRLVRAESIQRIDGQRLSRYRFRHILFQTYLYNSLDEVERIRLHEDVGGGLERLYGDRAEDIALELAHHFEEAGVTGKAVGYLYEAGAQAVRLSANEAAIMHYKRALRLLETLPEVDERLEKELALQLALTAPLEALKGFAAPETARAYARGYELSQQVGPTEQLVPALLSLATFYYARAEGQRSLHLIEQALDVALRKEDPLQVAIARWILAVALLNRGDLERAQVNLEHVIDFYDPRRHAPLVATLAQDLGVSVFAWASWTAWLRGYPDQALERSRQALALAEELGHTYTMGFALTIAGAYFHQLRREVQAAARQNERVVDLSTEERFPLFAAGGTILRGWTSAMEGQAEAGTTAVLQGLEELRAMGVRTMRSRYLAMLAEARARTGQTEAALSTLAEAIAFVEETGERYYEAEIHRLKGELLLREGEEAEAEASFEEAVKVARNQAAKSWELRATVSLCRLWHEQGKLLEARKRLSEVYGWFDEGFDTPDLIEARSLLQDLST